MHGWISQMAKAKAIPTASVKPTLCSNKRILVRSRWRVGISSVDDGTGEGSCAATAMVGAGRGGGDAPPLVPGLAPGRRGRGDRGHGDGDPEPHAGGARSALARTLQME
jgi:hypothetical protein